MKPSFRSRALFWLLKTIKFRRRIERKALRQIPLSNKQYVPAGIKRSFKINLHPSQTSILATYESRKNVTRNHILFFHGGAYLFKITPGHWKLSQKIVRKSFCRMTHIDYPLAPQHNYKETFLMVSKAYEFLQRNYPEDNFIFLGDSSGGGLALAFAQKLIKENHQKPPVKIILLSPWLDLTLSNPGIKKQEDSDRILSINMLRYAADQYAKGDSKKQFLLSPINGDFNKLPPSMIFFGTKELFYPDCKRLQSMTASKNQNIIFREFQNMQHDWAVFHVPESLQVINEVCDFLKNNSYFFSKKVTKNFEKTMLQPTGL